MGPLTEGSIKSNIKKQSGNTKPKTPPPAPKRNKSTKKEIKHNMGLHSQVSLCSIMSASLLFGVVLITLAKIFNFLIAVYVVSILISLGVIYLLPKFKSVNICHALNMKYDALVLWCILFLGPIMAMFILTTILLPPRKKVKAW